MVEDIMSNQTVYIYFLCEPDTGDIRYIGKTIMPEGRLRNHTNDRVPCHRTNWIKGLKARGLEPEMVIVEEIKGDWPWQESERYWINYAKAHGCRLVNSTDGGDGVCNLSGESKARMAKTWVGRKHRPESLLKIGAASRGRKHSQSSKDRMHTLMSAREITWGDKISETLRKISADQQIEINERINAGETVISLAVAFGVHRTTISKVKAGTYNDKYKRQ